ncbi:enterobactin synthase subunit E [Microbacterium oxydans]|uniref:(2,3-dihydroxybenzoyl)adenylate synthase n=1 Tax=Microbacterium oxydans TaxID=82380 RepID=UPI0007343BE9|nr:AMP-binding protein [Microbacterium oxydans]KTR76671.1 enterobactin synthase subunit E [Microbacterium oxydans]
MSAVEPLSVEPLTVEGVVPYPEEFAERYRRAGHWIGATFDALLREAVAAAPNSVAIVDGDRSWTYRDLDGRVGRLATALIADQGIRRGDRVVVQLPNIAEFVVVVFALFRAGAVPLFALPAHRRSELLHFCRTSEAVLIVTAEYIGGFDHAALATEVADLVPSVRGVLFASAVEAVSDGRTQAQTVPVRPEDIAFLQLSGGTTGTPKLIARTHDDYLYSVRESARICGLHAHSRMLVAMPVAHNFTMSSPGILGIIAAHGTIVLTTDPDPDTVLALIERHGVTIVPAVPPLVLSWLNAPQRQSHDLRSLEVVQVGGAKLSRSVAERIEPAFGCRLQQVFGMAEGLVNYTRLDDDLETVISTQGLRISEDDEVRVVDEADRPVPPGSPGALLTRGPYTIRGYFRAPEHDARSFTDDGFYRTGDIVIEREDGYLTVVGRSKDQINRGGEKIVPEEIENALLTHPDVHDAAVVGVPDDAMGERVHASVVLRPGPEGVLPPVRPVDLRRHLAAVGLAVYKVPDVFALVPELPATGVGKVDRRGVAAHEGSRS